MDTLEEIRMMQHPDGDTAYEVWEYEGDTPVRLAAAASVSTRKHAQRLADDWNADASAGQGLFDSGAPRRRFHVVTVTTVRTVLA